MRATVRAVTAVTAALLAGFVGPLPARAERQPKTPIRHFVFLMQGERSFDNYFGAYPGADGPPADTCLPLVLGRPGKGCVKPFALHTSAEQPPGASRSVVDTQINGGRMNGFVAAFQRQGRDGTAAMGYYDERDLAFSWEAARQYVLFDRFFSATPFGIRLNRSYWVAAAPPPGGVEKVPPDGYGDQPTIFDRLQAAGVSWKFYVQDYNKHETFRAASDGEPTTQTARVPLLNYARFVNDRALRRHIVDLDEYYRDLAQGTLPAVAYVASSGASERTERSIPAGQKLVRSMVTQLMLSRYWESSALLWSYDGGGGWYDHVRPPTIDGTPAGLRVPALLVSPYARKGQVNHTKLDYTSALRFIEQNWKIAPLTSRDASAHSLASAFDFAAGPRAARIIPVSSPTVPHGPTSVGPIYGGYGAAALLALLLLGIAARRRTLIASRHPAAVATDADTEVRSR